MHMIDASRADLGKTRRLSGLSTAELASNCSIATETPEKIKIRAWRAQPSNFKGRYPRSMGRNAEFVTLTNPRAMPPAVALPQALPVADPGRAVHPTAPAVFKTEARRRGDRTSSKDSTRAQIRTMHQPPKHLCPRCRRPESHLSACWGQRRQGMPHELERGASRAEHGARIDRPVDGTRKAGGPIAKRAHKPVRRGELKVVRVRRTDHGEASFRAGGRPVTKMKTGIKAPGRSPPDIDLARRGALGTAVHACPNALQWHRGG